MQLKLKEATVEAVRDSVLCHPLGSIVSTLSSNFRHFNRPSEINPDPLSLVVTLRNVGALVVEPAVFWSIASAILKEEKKES